MVDRSIFLCLFWVIWLFVPSSYLRLNSNTLLEGVCIRLTWWQLHNNDMTYVCLCLCMFVTTVIKCLSLNNDVLNANMTLFKMSLLWHIDINQYIITCQCFCHDNLTLNQVKLSCGWFWHWLSWGRYNCVMNIFRDLNYSGTNWICH